MASETKGSSAVEALLKEKRKFAPPKEFVKRATANRAAVYSEAAKNPARFWERFARELDWFKPWKTTLQWKAPNAKWFVGGKLNVAYNCLDRHVATSRKTKAAIIWEGEPGDTRVLTYWDLYREVNRFAAALKRRGVKKGDRVTIYMPMVPELPIAMLACARIGAPHSVVFGGFAPEALRDRIHDARVPHPDHRGRRLPARGHGRAQEERGRGAARVPRRPHRGRAQADRPGHPDAGRPRRLVGRLPQGRPRLLRAREDGLRGHAVPALHLGLHRQAQGHRAHHRRLPDRASTRPPSGCSTCGTPTSTGAPPTSAGSPGTPTSSTDPSPTAPPP